MLIFRYLEFKIIKYHNHNGGEKELKQIRALINKETLVYVCTQKKVSPQYLIRKGGFKEDRLNKWLNISETLLPTVFVNKKVLQKGSKKVSTFNTQ